MALFVSALVAAGLVLGSTSSASALGSGSASCNWGQPGQTWSRYTYQSSFSNAGGNTARSSDACVASRMGINLHYEIYPGSPTYWTGYYYGTYAVYRTQSGTFGGIHKQFNGAAWIGYAT